MELFEAYIDCPKCGVICLQCASGCGDAYEGGCVEEIRSSPETVPSVLFSASCSAGADTHVSISKFTSDVVIKAESRFDPAIPAPTARHAMIGNMLPVKGDVTGARVPEWATKSPSPSPLPSPHPHSLAEAKEDCPTQTPSETPAAPLTPARVLHLHYPGARLRIKSPLSALSKTVKDFTALIIQLHPGEGDRIYAHASEMT